MSELVGSGAAAAAAVGNVRLRQYPSWIGYLMAVCTIMAGVFSSVVSTWMNKQDAPMCSDCKEEPFVGAMLQTQQMFIAEMIALVVWFADSWLSARAGAAPAFEFITTESELASASGQSGCHWYYWPMCAVCDFVATLMVNHAYQFTFAATVEMLRNFMVVMAAVFQVALLRKAVLVHQWFGVMLITAALILTAVPALLHPDEERSGEKASIGRTVVGVALAIGGTTIQAFQLLVEEWFFRKGRYPPLKAVGVEGCTGLLLSCIAWPIYQTTGAEDVSGSWYQLAHNKALIWISLGYLPCGTIFNICGLGTTKLSGGLLRGVCFAVRAPLVWLVAMIVRWQGYDSYSLAGALVFASGFTVYCNFYNILPATKDPQTNPHWFTEPVQCYCTTPQEQEECDFLASPEPTTHQTDDERKWAAADRQQV